MSRERLAVGHERRARHTIISSQKSELEVTKNLKMPLQSFASYVQNFATKFWLVQTFATLGAIHVQTFSLKIPVQKGNFGLDPEAARLNKSENDSMFESFSSNATNF